MKRESLSSLKALGDANRIRILKMLELRELCVCEVTEVLQLSSSTVSKHLSILREAGLITDSKDGKWVNYQLNKKTGSRLVRSLLALISANVRDTIATVVDSSTLGNSSITYDCAAARTGGGVLRRGFMIKPGSYKEVADS